MTFELVPVEDVVGDHDDVGGLDVGDGRLVEVGHGLDDDDLERVAGELLDLLGPLAHQLWEAGACDIRNFFIS